MELFPAPALDGHRAALRYLTEALTPGVKVESTPATEASEATAQLMVSHGSTIVVRLRAWADSEFTRRTRRPRAGVVWVLSNATPKLREELRAAGQSFIDPSGAVRIELPGLLVDRTDLGPADFPALPEAAIDPFADRSSLVVRKLLSESIRRTWGVRELAQAAGVGLGTASRVVDQLRQMDLLEASQAQGKTARVRVVDPQLVIDRWVRAYEWTRNASLAVHAPIGDPSIFATSRLPLLIFRDWRWALTLQAGASLVAPLASWDRVHVYVDCSTPRDLSLLAQANNWTSGDDGRLVLMRPYYRTSIWLSVEQRESQIGSPINVVSALQLVLDLWHYPLRGREQAEVIRDNILRPKWES